MRAGWLFAGVLLASCASEKLALLPPAGVDLSGRWKLNVADSDDPVRLAQLRNAPNGGAGANGSGGSQGGGGGGGRRGRGGQSAGAPGAGQSVTVPVPPVSSFSEVLQWPGIDLDVRQSAGAATFISEGAEQVYQPAGAGKKSDGSDETIGWDGKSLVIEMKADGDRPPLRELFEVSADGQRLVQVVAVTGGRSNGFSMSRVWDRVQ
jgi:hypothetical protein